MTSNIGSQFISDLEGNLSEDEIRNRVMDALKSQFKPEFLNRVDDIIIFHRLKLEQLKAIVDIQIDKMKKRLSREN
jgi:ATP-dependent Clp protease ATP-binding subunit ClpB